MGGCAKEKMKILVLGATGFVGRNVKEYLITKNYEVYSPTSKELNCIEEEEVRQYLVKNDFDIVLNFAVYGDGIDKSKDGTKVLEYNLRIYSNFAKYSYLYGKMIYTGSGAEYDKRYPIVDVKEEELYHRSIPIDQYGLMKYIVNEQIEKSNNIYNLRLFGVFGKYEDWKTKYISNLCCKAIKGIPLSMRKNCYFDYLWIEDFCNILEKFINLDCPKYKIYNVVSGKKIDLYSLAQIVDKVSRKNNKIIVCNEGWANEYTASNERITKELGGILYTNIEEAIEKLYQWYELNKEIINNYSLIYG